MLDYVPGHFQVIRHVRPKYACTACDAIAQAPAPAMPTPRGRATPATLAHLLVSKYRGSSAAVSPERDLCPRGARNRPLDVGRLGRPGGLAARSGGGGDPAACLRGGKNPRRRHHRAGAGAGARADRDRTAMGLCARRPTVCGPAAPAAAYFYSPDRGAEHPTAHMASFTGFLQADGYAGFEGLYNPARTKPGPITEVACLGPLSRRKFFDVWETTKSPIAKEALDRIAEVYAIEDKARFAPAAERVEHRRETAPLLDAFFTWAGATVGKLSGKLELAKAFRYTIDAARGPHPLRHRRAARGRQQRRRERDARHCTRKTELFIRRFG